MQSYKFCNTHKCKDVTGSCDVNEPLSTGESNNTVNVKSKGSCS